ncbi:MAG: outer membrane beta-barrel protein [Bacteroidales bacterium]|nr:outer membrane beta-barrel protein [Bacteroidales bacterium]
MKKTFILLLGLIVCIRVSSQNAPPNMPYFDDKPFHFGIVLGLSSLSTNVAGTTDLPLYDSIYSYTSIRNSGVQIGVISDLKLLSWVHLRLIPTLVLTDRTIEYEVLRHGQIKTIRTPLEVIYLEAPLELKVMAKRYGNFRPYLIGGAKYSYDIGSIKRKKLSPDEYLMKLEQNELFYTLGVGFDFYLPMCKIGLELKSSFGLNDILDHSFQNAYTDCIDKMKSQLFYVNLTFE